MDEEKQKGKKRIDGKNEICNGGKKYYPYQRTSDIKIHIFPSIFKASLFW